MGDDRDDLIREATDVLSSLMAEVCHDPDHDVRVMAGAELMRRRLLAYHGPAAKPPTGELFGGDGQDTSALRR